MSETHGAFKAIKFVLSHDIDNIVWRYVHVDNLSKLNNEFNTKCLNLKYYVDNRPLYNNTIHRCFICENWSLYGKPISKVEICRSCFTTKKTIAEGY